MFRSSDDKRNTRGLHVPSRITQGARVSRANGQSCFSAREKSKETPATKDAPWRATVDDFDRAPSGRMKRTPTTHPAMCSRTVPRGTLVIRPLASLESSSVSRLVARSQYFRTTPVLMLVLGVPESPEQGLLGISSRGLEKTRIPHRRVRELGFRVWICGTVWSLRVSFLVAYR